ncbi:MAG: PaaI family thioesterase [Syntrophomonas sp.]
MQKQPGSRNCFVCGRQNEIGLKMTWVNDIDNNQIRSVVTIPESFNGYPGIVHGGIVATMLDETSGRAILIDGDMDKLFVTARLDIKYRNPTPTDTPLTVVGWVIKQKGSYAQVAAEIRLPDGKVTAECTALVVKPTEEFYANCNWDEEKEFWKVYED